MAFLNMLLQLHDLIPEIYFLFLYITIVIYARGKLLLKMLYTRDCWLSWLSMFMDISGLLGVDFLASNRNNVKT